MFEGRHWKTLCSFNSPMIYCQTWAPWRKTYSTSWNAWTCLTCLYSCDQESLHLGVRDCTTWGFCIQNDLFEDAQLICIPSPFHEQLPQCLRTLCLLLFGQFALVTCSNQIFHCQVMIKLFRCPGASLLLGWCLFFQFLRDPISELVRKSPDGNKHFYRDKLATSGSIVDTCKHLVLPGQKKPTSGNDTLRSIFDNICL